MLNVERYCICIRCASVLQIIFIIIIVTTVISQRKVWSRMVDDLFKSLDIDKSEWLEDRKHGDTHVVH